MFNRTFVNQDTGFAYASSTLRVRPACCSCGSSAAAPRVHLFQPFAVCPVPTWSDLKAWPTHPRVARDDPSSASSVLNPCRLSVLAHEVDRNKAVWVTGRWTARRASKAHSLWTL